MITVSIIIVNYNTGCFTQKAIQSILKQNFKDYQIIVIDNASTDNSIKQLKQISEIKLIINKKNIGFGAANNLVCQNINSKYIYFFNPDIELITTDSLGNLIKFLDESQECGLVTSCLNEDKSLFCFNYPGEKFVKSIKFNNLPGEISWCLGANMLIRNELFKQINGFDEYFFLYAEDTDLCLRVRQAGYAIGYCKDCVVKHFGGSSEIKTPKEKLFAKKQKALQKFYNKHYTNKEKNHVLYYQLKTLKRHIKVTFFMQYTIGIFSFKIRKKYKQKNKKYFAIMKELYKYI
mgnify:CR=1 FL=1